MSVDGQGTEWHTNITENFKRLSKAHERYRQQTHRQTDSGRHIANLNVFAFAYNKKLCYRKEHSASVLFRWSTLSHLLGENLLMANQPLSRNGLRKLPNWAK